MKRILVLVLLILCLTACVSRKARRGQTLFAGCKVDNQATLESGEFVCDGPRVAEPFGGNGRSCGSCHMPGDNFGISMERTASLPMTHPFFSGPGDEDQQLLVGQGLVHVIAPEIDEFRRTPKLVHLAKLCGYRKNCDALGLLGDRTRNLCDFSRQAVENHFSKTTARVPGEDFRIMTDRECNQLSAYMVSRLVSKQDERNRE